MNNEIRCLSVEVEDSSNTTVTLLAGLTGVIYTIYGYDISIASADTLHLYTGTNKRVGYYFGANSGISRTLHPTFFRSNAGEAVTLTKGTGATPVIVTLYYVQDNP